MKIKILSIVLIFLLVFTMAGVCCPGGKSGTSENDSSSSDSSSQSDSGRSNSSSDSNSNSDSGRSDQGDRNGLPKDCDPWGVTGPLCPEKNIVEYD